MVLKATDDFQVEWPSPDDARQVWIWDQMHNPRPLPPIAARGYAIQAVVGTVVATERIPDGAVISVDGGQGIVRVED